MSWAKRIAIVALGALAGGATAHRLGAGPRAMALSYAVEFVMVIALFVVALWAER